MSGRGSRLFALVLVLCLGTTWNCRADKTSTEQTKPAADSFSGLEILSRPPAHKKGEKISPEAAIQRALETRVRVKLDEIPLNEVCKEIGKKLGIPVVLDRQALGEEGLDPEITVSRSIGNTRLRSALDLILMDADLTWTIHREVLLITTITASQELLETRVYDVTDLVAVPEFGGIDFASLQELISIIISPNSWQEVGGEGGISIINGAGIQAIAVLQTFRNHEEIGKLLAALRTHIPNKANKTIDGAKSEDRKIPTEEETIRRALRKKVDLSFDEIPLSEVADHLQELLQIEVQVHNGSLDEEGLDIEMPVSLRITGIPAAVALDLMLRELGITYTIRDNYLLLLTKTAEEELSSVNFFDVADLVSNSDDLFSLPETITSTIAPCSWTDVGGEGSIVPFENAGMKVLVVSQTQKILDNINKLLVDLRRLERKVKPKTPTPGIKNPSAAKSGSAGIDKLATTRFRRPIPVKKDPRRNALVKSNNQFAFELYSKLRDDAPGENMFFSPMSISTGMAMAHVGARGKTAKEIAQVMHFTLPSLQLHPTCRSLLKITQNGAEYELDIANRLWVQSGHTLLEDFLRITKNYYGAECGLVDFAKSRQTAIKEINSWIEDHTRGRIHNLVGPHTFDDYTRLVLTNTIHFKGKWSKPFAPRDTKAAPFFAEEGKRQVEMMSIQDNSCKYAWIEDASLQILEKPYDSSFDLSMVILLPKREPGALAQLEINLTDERLATWSKGLHRQTMKVFLPKFRLKTAYSLKKQLTELGMLSAFGQGTDAADFSGIDGTRSLYLQAVLHQAFVEVDERGTEAAATTMGVFMGGIPIEPSEFLADHPFVFLIRDNRTGCILFLGRYCGPESDMTPSVTQRGGGMFESLAAGELFLNSRIVDRVTFATPSHPEPFADIALE